MPPQYRPPLAPLTRAQTNFTEAYDVALDPWQVSNLAAGAHALPPPVLAEWSNLLWDVATCAGAACP